MPEFTQRFSLAGKTALVTGASKGIGKEICRVLADAGADIAAVARDRDGLAETKRTVEAMGRRCLAIEADLATVDGPMRAARRHSKRGAPSTSWSTTPASPQSRASWRPRWRAGTGSWRSICARRSCWPRRSPRA